MTELAYLFQRTAAVLHANRADLNQADPYNGDHGDHMLEIFELASNAAGEKAGEPLADVIQYTSHLLAGCEGNGSAALYSLGLAQFGAKFQEFGVTLDNLVAYIQSVLIESNKASAPSAKKSDEGDVLKALLSGLAGWRAVAQDKEPPKGGLDTGYLFDLGVAYMQAKARGGTKSAVIADAAVSVSPLNELPYRARSGRLVIRTILEAFQLQG